MEQATAGDTTAIDSNADALDSALGRSSTVLISLDAGRRYRLGREERVR